MARPLVDGIFVLTKREGGTSMDMVRLAKHVTRVKSVDREWTLNPISMGVMPMRYTMTCGM